MRSESRIFLDMGAFLARHDDQAKNPIIGLFPVKEIITTFTSANLNDVKNSLWDKVAEIEEIGTYYPEINSTLLSRIDIDNADVFFEIIIEAFYNMLYKMAAVNQIPEIDEYFFDAWHDVNILVLRREINNVPSIKTKHFDVKSYGYRNSANNKINIQFRRTRTG